MDNAGGITGDHFLKIKADTIGAGGRELKGSARPLLVLVGKICQ